MVDFDKWLERLEHIVMIVSGIIATVQMLKPKKKKRSNPARKKR